MICDHQNDFEWVYKVDSIGRKTYHKQCECGVISEAVSLKYVRNFVSEAEICPADIEAHSRGSLANWRARREQEQAAFEQSRRELSHEKREENSDYYASPKWRDKRRLVLARDHYKCQACLKAQAWDVHHLTYDHFGDEFLWELASICRECHERLHPHMKVEPVYEWDE